MATINKDTAANQRSHVAEAATDLLNESKKYAGELYEEGINKVNSLYEESIDKAHQAEDAIKLYSDELLKKVQQNPLASVLIAGGIGFLLSKLLKK